MKNIFLKEISYYLKDARLYLGFTFIVLSMGVGALLYGRHYIDSLSEHSKAVSIQDEKSRDLSYRLSELAEEDFNAFRRPRKLQFVVDGEDDMRPNMITYSTAHVGNPEVSSTLSYQMRRFERLDWAFAIGVLASFLAVVMSFNSLSGEKEEGTLKLLLVNSASRTSVITAKYLALAVSSFFPVVVGAVLSMSVMSIVTASVFTMDEVLRLFIILCLGFLLLLVFVSLGLLVSAITHQSTRSLVLLLLIWIVSVIIIPSLSRLIAQNVRAVVPASEVDRRIGELLGEALEEYSGRDISHAPREALPVDESEFLWDEMMDKVENRMQEILDGNLRRKMNQVRSMELMASVSPVSLFRKGAGDIIGTGLTEDEFFYQDVRNQREGFLEFLRAKDAQDPESPHILYRKWYMSYKPVDPGTIPRYNGKEVSVDLSLRKGVTRAVCLAALAAILFVFALAAFQKMDAR
jgi:ABC-type transport system involved in multi-copper enzyme maturation permease subunit